MQYKQTKYGLLHGLITKDQFRLAETIKVKTGITGHRAVLKHITLYEDGTLVLGRGYKWDGASGPTWDTDCTIKASAVHDALYRLIKHGKIPFSQRWRADGELWRLMRQNGAHWFRALYYLAAVQMFGKLWICFHNDLKES